MRGATAHTHTYTQHGSAVVLDLLLCQDLVNVWFAAHPPPRPQLSEDLFEMYGLTGLAAEVARVLPNGEKNALRKTYKGHIRKLGVQGHFDEVKQDPARRDGLIALMKCPDDVWDAHFVRGKNVLDGLSSEANQKLHRAVTMAKGFVPKTLWDSSVLGDLAPGRGDRQTPRPSAPGTPLGSAGAPGGVPRPKVGTPVPHDPSKPKRGIKKRGYGDSSFDGYGEGYPDDDLSAETGYSTGEGEMVSGQKWRKKVLIDGRHPADEIPLLTLKQTHQGNQPYAQGPARQQPAYGAGITGTT